jgi:imidazolonepropionase-like amidohydrolase
MATAIRAGWLWDGTGGAAIKDGVVVFEGDTISTAGPAASTPIPEGATLIDRPGEFLMPGLIDAHTHITVRPGLGDQIGQLMQPVERQTLRGVGNLRRILRSGVTTARIMGEEGWVDLAFKEEVAKGESVGPKLIVSTRMITQSNGHGRALSAFDGIDEVRKASRENLYHGAEFLKLFITGGVSSTRGGGIRAASYSFDEMRVAVEEAERAFTYVAAHAIGGPGIRLGVEAGIRTIEHANMATDDDLALIKEKGAWVVLTQSILLHPSGIEQGDRHNPVVMAKLKDARAQAAERLPAIVASGVRYAIGTDSMHGLLPFEVAKLVDWGASNSDALLAATRWAAECCRIEEKTGTITPGKAADLITVDGNPLEEITALERVKTIIKGGKDYSGLSER